LVLLSVLVSVVSVAGVGVMADATAEIDAELQAERAW
jgi:hypothetical protein